MSNSWAEHSAVPDTTQEAVLLAAVDRIRSKIPVFSTEKTCFVSDTPAPAVEVEDNLFCTVSPTTSGFIDADEEGGGQYQIVEEGQIQITVFSRLATDREDRTINELTDESRGLLKLKRQILREFAGKKLYRADAPEVSLLINGMKPRRAIHPPSRQHDDDFASFSLVFTTDFCWDLSDE